MLIHGNIFQHSNGSFIAQLNPFFFNALQMIHLEFSKAFDIKSYKILLGKK